MIEWIIARSEGDRGRVGALAGVVCISLNVLLCIAKALVGILSGSVSIVADALNNLSDASSNIVSVLGFKLASKPADRKGPGWHPVRVGLDRCRRAQQSERREFQHRERSRIQARQQAG